MPDLRLLAARYDHPDAVALTEVVQGYYEEIYGGRDGEVLEPMQLAPPSGGFFVGYAEREAVAMGGWTYAAHLPQPGDAQIRRMFTHPRVQRRGYARRLLTALERDAAAIGARRLILSTGYRQPSAVSLYRACGYVDIEPFGYYGGKSGVVCLAKELGRDRPDRVAASS